MYALVFLPHFLPKRRTDAGSPAFRSIIHFNNIPFDRKKGLLIALAAVVVLGIVLSPKVRFDSDLRNLNYRRPALVEAENLFTVTRTSSREITFAKTDKQGTLYTYRLKKQP